MRLTDEVIIPMNKSMWKTTLREIRSSFGRYIAIFAIIALGVGFFSGLKVTRQVMVEATDKFVSEHGMFDYRLISTLGLTDTDVEAIRALPEVDDAYGAYQADAIVDDGSNEFVVRFHSFNTTINVPSLKAGRLPSAPGEAVADARFYPEFALGKTVRLAADNTSETFDNFTRTEFTIVGLAYSPLYMNYERGTSSIGNGVISYFFIVPPEDFNVEAYTDIYLRLKDNAFIYSDEYNDLIDAHKSGLETALEERALIRYNGLYADARAELDDARAELDDARVKLDDAHKELEDGRNEITDKEKELEDARIEIADKEQEIVDGEREIADNEKKLEDAEREIADNEKKLADGEREIADNRQKLEDAETTINDNKNKLQDARQTIDENKRALEEGERALAENETKLTETAAMIAENEARLESANTEITEKEQMLMAAKEELAQKEAEFNVAAQLLPEGDPTLEAARQAIAAAGLQIEQGEAALAEGKAEYEQGLAMLTAAKTAYESGKAEFDSAREELEKGKLELAGAEKELESGEQELINAEKELEDGKLKLEDAQKELEDGRRQLKDAKKEVSDGWNELNDAKKELEEGKQKLADAKEEIADGEVKLSDARNELADGESELAEKETEFDDATVKVSDAEQELADFKEPTTYTLTRNENVGYTCFENDSMIVDGIADVFPVFFFLVAALVCVTTMSRMIEEQRTQIGILKALGYSETTIIAKYLIYSGSAALTGCIGGFFLGCYAFPKIIWIVYGLLYGFTDIEYVFNVKLFIISIVVSLICSAGTTYISCKRDLHMMAAELIRPKAPKNGKRILLERITFIWRKIKFLHKVSIRNVFRYKGRFVMMMLGIGGCAGLIITGFGIRDSITEIADEQYTQILVYDELVNFSEVMSPEDINDFEQEFSDTISAFMPVCQVSADPVDTDSVRSVQMVFLAHESGWKDVLLLHDKSGTQLPYPKKGEAILTHNVAEANGLNVGDTVTFRDSDFNEFKVTVSGICDNYFNSYAYLDASSYTASDIPPYKSVFVNIREGSDLHEAAAAFMNHDKVATVNVNADTLELFSKMMQTMNYIVVLIITCAAALAFIVLYNLTNINITERIREIATIKVLGFYPIETASYVFRENLALTGIGYLVGIPIGLWLHNFVMTKIDIDMVSFDIHINGISYIYSLLFTFAFAIFVDFVMYFKLARINMAESLKSIE